MRVHRACTYSYSVHRQFRLARRHFAVAFPAHLPCYSWRPNHVGIRTLSTTSVQENPIRGRIGTGNSDSVFWRSARECFLFSFPLRAGSLEKLHFRLENFLCTGMCKGKFFFIDVNTPYCYFLLFPSWAGNWEKLRSFPLKFFLRAFAKENFLFSIRVFERDIGATFGIRVVRPRKNAVHSAKRKYCVRVVSNFFLRVSVRAYIFASTRGSQRRSVDGSTI